MPSLPQLSRAFGPGRSLPTRAIALAAAVSLASAAIARAEDNVSPAQPQHQPSAAGLPVFDLAGKPVDPFSNSRSNTVVLIFISAECPISNRYAPEVRRLCERFASRPVRFWLVQPEDKVSVERTRRHLREYRYPCELLRDPRHVLVKKCKATTTPECAVFSPDGQLIYHGRIDNRYVDFGKMRPRATEHDLQDAIEAALNGKAPARSSAPAIGCTIPDPS